MRGPAWPPAKGEAGYTHARDTRVAASNWRMQPCGSPQQACVQAAHLAIARQAMCVCVWQSAPPLPSRHPEDSLLAQATSTGRGRATHVCGAYEVVASPPPIPPDPAPPCVCRSLPPNLPSCCQLTAGRSNSCESTYLPGLSHSSRGKSVPDPHTSGVRGSGPWLAVALGGTSLPAGAHHGA